MPKSSEKSKIIAGLCENYMLNVIMATSRWQALWKIPRNICEKFKIRYPSIVFGFVEHVIFQDLTVIFNIKAVQDEGVHLPERHEVALEDLWPTINQENTELNIERTADCVDRLRFFYTHIWMPWDNDNDDDFNWVEKHIQSRLQLCFDLQQHNISRPITTYIHSLIAEAKYIHQKRENIEEDIFDDESDTFDKKIVVKPRLTQLMLMHFRLTVIRSHIEMLENPDMRPIYEDLKFNKSKSSILSSIQNGEKNTDPSYHMVFLPSSISNQIELLRNAEGIIPKNSSVFFNHSLQDVLDTCKSGDNIFLSPGCHMIHFLEYLFNSGQISGIKCISEPKNYVRIYSTVSNSSLLVFDGDFILENIELDCRNILAGVIVKHGILTMRNCKLIGNGKSSIQQGVICNGHASIHMKKCIIDNFATGVILSENSTLILEDSFVSNCNIGLEITELSNVKCYKSSFHNCSFYAICLSGLLLKDVDDNIVKLKDFKDLEKYKSENLQVSSDCCFENCSNIICIINDKKCIISRKTLNYIENIF